MRRSILLSVLTLSVALPLGAQLPPVRPLGPIVATSTEQLASVPSIRALPDGRVLVSDMTKRRLVMLDSMLAHPELVLTPTGAAASQYPARGGTLFPFHGDTTLVLDAAGYSFIAIDPRGKVAHVMSVPRASDVYVITNPSYGQPAIDPGDRLIYRTQPKYTGFSMATGQMMYIDSTAIVAVSFITRHVDTLGYIKIPPTIPSVMTLDPNGTRRFSAFPTAFELIDEWAALPDGRLAIIRWKDYHVDWIAPDKTKTTSPPTSWNWVRLTDDEKGAFTDSLRVRNQKSDSMQSAFTTSMNGGGMYTFAYETMVPSPSQVPDYPPPFVGRATKVDLDGRIWLLERGKVGATSTALVYDIIDSNGQICDRVQMPPNAAVIGFGPGGAVYLSVGPSNASLASSIPPIVPPSMTGAPPPVPVKLAKAILAKKP